MRRFLLVADRARSAADVLLHDLAGHGGRFDLVARFAASALLTSHGVRADTECIVLLLGPPNPPRALRLRGSAVKWLRPDERSCAGKLVQALRPFATPVWQDTGEGIELSRKGLQQILDEDPGPIVLLDEAGDPSAPPADALFVLGDDRGLGEEQLAVVRKRAARTLSVGPVALQADQCVTIAHNRLDTLMAGRAGRPS